MPEGKLLCGGSVVSLKKMEGRETAELEIVDRDYFAYGQSAGQNYVISSRENDRLTRFDLETQEKVGFHANAVGHYNSPEFDQFSVSFDGAMVAVGFVDGTAKVWDVANRRLIGVLRGLSLIHISEPTRPY